MPKPDPTAREPLLCGTRSPFDGNHVLRDIVRRSDEMLVPDPGLGILTGNRRRGRAACSLAPGTPDPLRLSTHPSPARIAHLFRKGEETFAGCAKTMKTTLLSCILAIAAGVACGGTSVHNIADAGDGAPTCPPRPSLTCHNRKNPPSYTSDVAPTIRSAAHRATFRAESRHKSRPSRRIPM
jgi:hypothetical protein